MSDTDYHERERYLRADNDKLRAEVERLQARLRDAGTFTLSERWIQQQAEIERLQTLVKNAQDAIGTVKIERLEAEIERVRSVITAADVLRTRWLNDGHGLREPGLSEFKEARQAYDEARARLRDCNEN